MWGFLGRVESGARRINRISINIYTVGRVEKVPAVFFCLTMDYTDFYGWKWWDFVLTYWGLTPSLTKGFD